MKSIGMFILLIVAYTLVWFLGTTGLFIVRSGNTPNMTMSMAAVLGFLTAILHVVIGMLLD